MEAESALIDDLKTLNEIAQTLNKAVDVRSALQSTLEQLVTLMGLETGWIFVHDPLATERWAGRGFRLAAYHNLPPALDITKAEAWEGNCSCQTSCRRGELSEAYNEVRCSRLAESHGDRRGLAVHASTPLVSGEQVLGILNVAALEWSDFSERSLALLTNVGSQMGIALERARLFDLVREQRVLEQAALLELSNQLLGRTNVDELINYLVQEVRELLQVDACAVLLPGYDPNYLCFRAASGWRSNPVANRFRVPADISTSGQVMRTQQAIVVDDTLKYEPPEDQAAQDMIAWLQGEGFRSAAIVPLVAEGESIGTLVIDTREPREFSKNDLRLLQLMANQAAIAIEKARLHEEELRRQRIEEELAVGRKIQLSMLPKTVPTIDGWEFAAVYEAARQVGGDFYDFFTLPGERPRWGVVIADVSDKGVPAALFMALSRTTIRNTALRGHPPAEALAWANRYIQEDSQADLFITVFYAELDPQSSHVTYSNAGHNWPLWWHAATAEFEELSEHGIVLGVLADVELEQRTITVAPGDVLVLYTDGVTEAINDDEEEFGRERLRAAVADCLRDHPEARAQDVLRSVLTAVDAFTGDRVQYDDITLCIIKRQPPA